MTTREQVDSLTSALHDAWIAKDVLAVIEISARLAALKRKLEMEIDMNVARCFMAARNITRDALN